MYKEKTQFKFKSDRYAKARGSSCFYAIFCSQCNQPVALYQKDGPGALLRMYLDRIFAPPALADLQHQVTTKTDMPNMACPKCEALIGIPMVYESEKRLAFRMVRGSFARKGNDGVFPPV